MHNLGRFGAAACSGGSCGPKATIQAGIDAADPGDEVVVADGTYTGEGNKNLDLAGKPIALRSASGNPAMCVIDCRGEEGRGFYFHTGEGPDSVVEGFAITNGRTHEGGGISCKSNSSPTFTNRTIRENWATEGGGVYCGGSSPTFTNCILWGDTPDEVYDYVPTSTFTFCDVQGGCPGGDPDCWDLACPWRNADCDGDGNVTFDDIDPFVARFGAICP